MKGLMRFLLASTFILAVSAPMLSQESTTTNKAAKEARWEGNIIRISPDRSSMDVRQVGGTVEKTIHIDSATAWTSQYHGDKNINKIDSSQVKEGDRVICVGKYNDKNEFVATTVSKRLSHSPN